jgi:hypothetical protein
MLPGKIRFFQDISLQIPIKIDFASFPNQSPRLSLTRLFQNAKPPAGYGHGRCSSWSDCRLSRKKQPFSISVNSPNSNLHPTIL